MSFLKAQATGCFGESWADYKSPGEQRQGRYKTVWIEVGLKAILKRDHQDAEQGVNK